MSYGTRSLALGLAFGSLSILTLTPSVRAQIFQPGTQPLDSAHPDALTVGIQTNSGCARCHSNYADDGDYEPFDSWRGSMMGNAARDPVARAALAIAEGDVPGAADFCVRCHSTFTWYNGGSSAPDFHVPTMTPRFAPDEPGALSPDLDGVACMSCHRSEDPGDAQIHNTQLRLSNGQERLGPYEYAPGDPTPPHEASRSAFISSSRFCGQCHDIHNPLLTGYTMSAGGMAVPTGRPFSIERTFSEWQHSVYGEAGGADEQSCQGCHMPEVGRPVNAASDFPVLRDHMSRHDLAGGSVWQPLAILDRIPTPTPLQTASFMASSNRSRAMLENAATLEIVTASLTGDQLSASFRVTNTSGHKLPTGYPEGRRMWLEIEVLDGADRVVASSARYDDMTDTLAEDAQARVYEVKLGERQDDNTVDPSFHFILNDVTMIDTRIPPRGFTAPAELDMAPIGRDYAVGDGTYNHFDEPAYTFRSLCGTGNLRVRARLRYQSNSREYMEFLRDGAPASLDPALGGRSWGQVAYDGWRAHDGDVPITMETVEMDLGASPGRCPDPDAAVLVDAAASPDATASLDAAMRADAAAADAAPGNDTGPGSASGGGCGCRASTEPVSALGWASMLATLSAVVLRRRRKH
jgi:hypothetical protein